MQCLVKQNRRIIDKVEGANVPEVVRKTKELASAATRAQQKPAKSAPAPAPTTQYATLEEKLVALINSAPVMLFMKGHPAEPRCGFSSKMVKHLQSEQIPFSSFDILTDEEVRQGLKTFSNWPTFPQLYAHGKLIGGVDIVEELVQDGELKSALGLDVSPETLNDRLQKLINQAPVMLFMKGHPSEPRCGFSAKMVKLLNANSVQFDSFDILTDEQVRQGLKTYSNWPTYPQLYAKGKLIGGVDIVEEMAQDGELGQALGL